MKPKKKRKRSALLSQSMFSEVVEAQAIVVPDIDGLPGFEKLDDDSKVQARHETKALAGDIRNFQGSQLALAERLTRIQAILTPRGLFDRYLREFHFPDRRQVYRAIAKFKNARKHLPPQLLSAAMMRNMELAGEYPEKPLGKYTAAFKKLPIPKELTPERTEEYLDQLEATRRQLRAAARKNGNGNGHAADDDDDDDLIPQDPNTLLKETYRFVMGAYRRLDNNPKTKRNWLATLFGMILGETGVTNPQTFEPEAVPEGFRQFERGRPKSRVAA